MENPSDIGNSRGRAAEEGEKSRDGLLFVQKEIFRNPKRAMCAHHRYPDHQRRNEHSPDARHKDDNNRKDCQDSQHLPVAIGSIEQNQGLPPQQIKEDPAP